MTSVPGVLFVSFASHTLPLHFPWVYLACFHSLRPALSIGPGLISLLFFSTPRSLDQPGAYFASLPLYAPLSRSPLGLFCFFSSLRPALSISPGLISLLTAIYAPLTQKNCLRRQHRHEAGCFLNLNSLYLNKWHFFATFTSRYPLGKLRSSCSVMPRIRISMTK